MFYNSVSETPIRILIKFMWHVLQFCLIGVSVDTISNLIQDLLREQLKAIFILLSMRSSVSDCLTGMFSLSNSI